jgi:hypothetical protein
VTSKGSTLREKNSCDTGFLECDGGDRRLAQEVNLTGPYHCVTNCAGSGPAIVTQNGWDLNLVNEIGMPSRGWVDWPGHIWVQSWNEGAIYSPDGMTIQFDRGTVWQRTVILNSGG